MFFLICSLYSAKQPSQSDFGFSKKPSFLITVSSFLPSKSTNFLRSASAFYSMCMPKPWTITVQTSSGDRHSGRWCMYESMMVSKKECFRVYRSLTSAGGLKHPNEGPIPSPAKRSKGSTKSFKIIVGFLSLCSRITFCVIGTLPCAYPKI